MLGRAETPRLPNDWGAKRFGDQSLRTDYARHRYETAAYHVIPGSMVFTCSKGIASVGLIRPTVKGGTSRKEDRPAGNSRG